MKFILSLKMLALFEFIPTQEILAWLGLVCSSDCQEAVPEEDRSGVNRLSSSDNWLTNGGILLLGGFFFIIVCLLIVFLVKKDYLKWFKRINKVIKKVHQNIFYNGIIRYVQTSSIKLQIMCVSMLMLEYRNEEFDSSLTGMLR